MDDRKQFDEWWKENQPKSEYLDDYNDDVIWGVVKDAAWSAWQASKHVKPIAPEITKRQVVWDIELMYKHRGERSPRFLDLGKSTHQEYQEALTNGKRIGENWLAENFKDDEIESWDVKVRPSRS